MKRECSQLSGRQHGLICEAIENVRGCNKDVERNNISKNLLDFLWQLEGYGFISASERITYMDALLVANAQKGKAGAGGVKVHK